MRRGLWALVGVVVIAVAAVALISYVSNLDRETRSESFEDVTRVVFDLDNSPIEFVAGEGDVVVDMSTSTGFMGGAARVEQDGQTLLIFHECPPLLAIGCQASFAVRLPSETEVSGSTSNGAVSLTFLDGPVSVTTSNGSITLEDVSSDVALQTSNGRISGTSVSSARLEASTSNGRIDLGFIAAPNQVRATTSNGSIEILLPDDAPAYAVTTSTSNGRVVTEVRTDPAATDTIDTRTSNGNIAIRYQSSPGG